MNAAKTKMHEVFVVQCVEPEIVQKYLDAHIVNWRQTNQPFAVDNDELCHWVYSQKKRIKKAPAKRCPWCQIPLGWRVELYDANNHTDWFWNQAAFELHLQTCHNETWSHIR